MTRRRVVNLKTFVLTVALSGGLVVSTLDAAPPPLKSPTAKPTPVMTEEDGVRIRARSALVLNMQSGEVMYQKNPTAQVPIASITKLMSAVTLMNMNPDLGQRITIVRQDVYRANHTYLKAREELTVRDLLHASLIASDNAAARALARASGLSNKEFVDRMNQTAASLGLLNSNFVDPTGLYSENVSTAIDCAALLWTALQNETLSEILAIKEYAFKTNRRVHTIRTTNRLLRGEQPDDLWDIIGGKTGFIRSAGYCLVTRARNHAGDDVIAVVLGGTSSSSRFADMHRLLEWGFRNIEPQALIGG
ncbi:MAG: D-alanyl-D-alanine carboxypeptidase [candidate division Zixibacteria bacterium]|nr:D-alanyl-D-alanine carboxypeptidase [candidate division Zixibacteria bacterium]